MKLITQKLLHLRRHSCELEKLDIYIEIELRCLACLVCVQYLAWLVQNRTHFQGGLELIKLSRISQLDALALAGKNVAGVDKARLGCIFVKEVHQPGMTVLTLPREERILSTMAITSLSVRPRSI